jgi:hypothetical protein
MLHAFSAQVFLAIITALAVHVSPDWRAPRERLEGVDILRIVAFTSTLALGSLAQALLGAGFRHRVLPVLPHAIVGAIVALFAVVSLASVRTIRFLRAPARLAVWIVGAQIALGIASYVLLESPGAEGRPVPLAVMVAVAHLGLGSAMIADSIVLSLRAFHLHWPWTS